MVILAFLTARIQLNTVTATIITVVIAFTANSLAYKWMGLQIETYVRCVFVVTALKCVEQNTFDKCVIVVIVNQTTGTFGTTVWLYGVFGPCASETALVTR